MPPPTFSGFSAEGLALLRAIGGADRDHFQANKRAYDELIATPAKAFVDAMTAGLQDRISPLVDGQPKTNGSIAPINNDLRFNPDASPYKDHVLFKWWVFIFVACNCTVHKRCHDKVIARCPGNAINSVETKVT